VNYLAHMVLSDGTPLSLVGNLAGDFLHGVDVSALHPVLQEGIERHRAVDSFTDSHPLVRQTRNRLDPAWRHWRGVLVDVFYDHFLARDFEAHTGEPLASFASRAYAALREHAELLPPRLRRAVPVMIEYDWLNAYAYPEGVAQVLAGMSRRSRRSPGLQRAVPEMVQLAPELAQDFSEFFPQLQTHLATVNP
jgi:acyl carrier protein phosphodiesterase